MGDHAEHGDAEAQGRVVHGLGDAEGQQPLLVRRAEARLADRREGADQTGHGAQQTDQGGDVRQGPQGPHPLLQLGLELGEALGQGRVDLVGALVRVGQPRLYQLQDRVVARLAQLDGAVDVASGHQLLHLGKELLGVHTITGELEHGALDHEGEHDAGGDHVADEEVRVRLQRCAEGDLATCRIRCRRGQQKKVHPWGSFPTLSRVWATGDLEPA